MRFLIKALLVLALTIGVGKAIYKFGWLYKAIEHPVGFEVYSFVMRTFDAIGPEDAENLILDFTLLLSLVTALFVVWVGGRLLNRFSRRMDR